MIKKHIVFYGHFGVGNLGNDTTLESAIHNAKKIHPDAMITCICRGPSVISSKYGIVALPVDIDEDRRPGEGSRLKKNVFFRVINRIKDELAFWIIRPKWFKTVDHFVVVGTGAIHDGTAPPWNVPYDLFKWCGAARLGGAKVVFMSVGAGPIYHPVSRFLFLQALRMATYRSFRDKASFRFLESVGFDARKDHLYPDVVFSLPVNDKNTDCTDQDHAMRVGLGVLAYYGRHADFTAGEQIYQTYVNKLKLFSVWLLREGFSIRFLTGDLENDPRPADELVEFIKQQAQPGWRDRVFAEPISNVQELTNQIIKTDIVVASRFHNIVAALMVGRPVISIGFHEKNDSIMQEFGLENYCQNIEELDVDKLIAQFVELRSNLASTSLNIQKQVLEYQSLLEEQYQVALHL
jgi:polysaccharide pyruvyl transferase WcaK-like protein